MPSTRTSPPSRSLTPLQVDPRQESVNTGADPWEAYASTVLEVIEDGRWRSLTPGDVGVEAVVITADNPFGRRESEAANRRARAALDRQLDALGATSQVARGRNADGTWMEISRLVHGLTIDPALSLGRTFGQTAVFVLRGRWQYVAGCTDGRLRSRRSLRPHPTLRTARLLPDRTELIQWSSYGMTYAQMRQEVQDRTGVLMAERTFQCLIEHAPREPDLHEVLPWAAFDHGSHRYPVTQLRHLAQWRAGHTVSSPVQLTLWLAQIAADGAILGFDPDFPTALWYIGQRPGEDLEIPIRREPVSIRDLKLNGERVWDFPY